MNKVSNVIVLSLIVSSVTHAQEIKSMIDDAKVSGDFRAISAGYKQEDKTTASTYATSLGGTLKYELAEYNGFSGAVGFSTATDVKSLSGEIKTQNTKQNAELSSSDGEYVSLSQAYLNYKRDSLNIRAGRQVIDTPLADSDDYLVIANSFEAYIATYEFSNITLSAGNLRNWQGTDAGLDDGWIDIGGNGAYLASLSYSGLVEANIYYYDFPMPGSENNSLYADVTHEYKFENENKLVSSFQYIKQEEKNNSGIESQIYGALVEFEAGDLGAMLAYNHSAENNGKQTFSGLGGGALFTSSYMNILDQVTQDREANALMLGLSYTLGKLDVSYSYASFTGEENSSNVKAELIEHDLVLEYSVSDHLLLHGALSVSEDMISVTKTGDDWKRFHISANYSF